METQRTSLKLMVTLGGGGFQLEARSLIRGLGDEFVYCFITNYDAKVPDEFLGAEINYLTPFANFRERRLRKRIPAFIKALAQSRKALQRSRPDCVICVGAAMAVPIGIVARVMRVPSIYIESITRFERPSLTAKLVARFKLADRLYVQWPDSVDLYTGGIYRGTVL